MTASRHVRIIILLIVAFSFVGVVYAAIVYVPVTNSGFISDLSGWTLIQEGGTVEWSEGGYSDAGEALVTCGGGGAGIAWQSFTNEVSPTIYTASAWYSCTAPGEILLGYWNPDMQGNISYCSYDVWSQCSVSFTIPSEIPSFEVYIGMESAGACEIDNVQLSYETPDEPESEGQLTTAFEYMLGNVIYTSIGFFTFFVLLAVGMWISKIKIVGGIKQRNDD